MRLELINVEQNYMYVFSIVLLVCCSKVMQPFTSLSVLKAWVSQLQSYQRSVVIMVN